MAHSETETLAALKLSLCEGVGGVVIHRLIEGLGSAEAALAAPVDRLCQIEGISEELARRIHRGPDERAVETELDFMQRGRVRLVPFTSEDYPLPLKHLDADAPPLLRMRGDYQRRDMLSVAIVGSRRSTHYGRAQARRFAMGLSGMGFTIVSGLARGIDAEAHRASLQAKGRTIAVLGCGLGMLDKLDEPNLALEIAENGALISELPMLAPPLPGHFPPRNRLISGLSLGVLVIEAGKKSGSLITARWAGQQGKAVFALPGNVDSPASHGCHQLIRDGALLVQEPRDVAEGLGPLSDPLELPASAGQEPSGGATGRPMTVDDARALTLNEREKQIYGLIEQAPLHIDVVIAQSGLPASIVSSTLLTLEIRGLARQLPGQRYVRA